MAKDPDPDSDLALWRSAIWRSPPLPHYPVPVKHAIVILSGAADRPMAELADRTPLAAAAMPALAALAAAGRVGTVRTCPRGWRPTAETCLLSIFGHDPAAADAARGPVEAAGLGIDTGEKSAMRLDLVTIGDDGTEDAGVVLDATGGGIPSAEADALLADLFAHWRKTAGRGAADLSPTPARGNRSIVLDASGRDYGGVTTAPPRFIVGDDAAARLPGGGEGDAAALLRELVESSYDFLRTHEINLTRADQGLVPANLAWFWGPGRTPDLPPLAARFGLRGAAIGAGPALRGVARLAGWDVVTDADGDDPQAAGRAAVLAVDAVDAVLVHLRAPDAAARRGDWEAKTEALETIDRAVITPLRARLMECGDREADAAAEGWRMMVLADHATPCATGEPDGTPPPVAMAGAWIRSAVVRPMHEAAAEASDMHIDPGHELLEFFLRGGLARTTTRRSGGA